MNLRQIMRVLERPEEANADPLEPVHIDQEQLKVGVSPLDLFTAPYASGVATIKAIKDRFLSDDNEPLHNDAERDCVHKPDAENGDGSEEYTAKNPEHCLSLTGRLREADRGTDNQWTAYSRKYREEQQRQRTSRQLDAKGIDAFQFELIEVDRAWWRMKVGNIPDVATHIWEALETTLPIHLIADDVQISAKDCGFWLSVFTRHLGVREETNSGRCVYSRNSEPADLSRAVEQKVQALH